MHKWKDSEDWDIWYYKHHTNLSNTEIGTKLGHTRDAVIGRFTRQGLALHPPFSRVPEKYKKYVR